MSKKEYNVQTKCQIRTYFLNDFRDKELKNKSEKEKNSHEKLIVLANEIMKEFIKEFNIKDVYKTDNDDYRYLNHLDLFFYSKSLPSANKLKEVLKIVNDDSVTLHNSSSEIKININDNYFSISFYTSPHTKIEYYDKKIHYTFIENEEPFKFKINITIDGDIYYVKNGKGSHQMTLAELYLVSYWFKFDEMIVPILRGLSTRFVLFKDVLEDFTHQTFVSAIPLNLFAKKYNKREVFKEYYNYDKKRANKDNIGLSIMYHKLTKQVGEDNIQKFYNIDWIKKVNGNLVTLSNRKIDLDYVFIEYIFEILKKNCPKNYQEVKAWEIADTIDLCRKLKNPFPLNNDLTVKSLREKHDEMSQKYTIKEQKRKKKDWNKVITKKKNFKDLELPQKYKRLCTQKNLVEEGTFQHNCVASYLDYIKKGLSEIYSLRISPKERYTIEIRYDKQQGYIIRQFLGKYNNIPEDENLEKDLEKILDEINNN